MSQSLVDPARRHPPLGPRGRGTARRLPVAISAALALLASAPTQAATLTVTVEGAAPGVGEVGCALFAAAAGFPLQSARAQMQWHPATAAVRCRYEDLAAGRYAVAASQDVNGNHRTDTNLFGIPTERWGVSNGVRPTLRAPRFDEAAFDLAADANAERTVRVQP